MTVVSDPPSATVVLDGEIDIATAPAIRRFLMAAINGGDVHLAVDMSGVTFIDASGIGVLVAAANRAREAGGSLSLLAPSAQLRWLLDVFHLDAILPGSPALRWPLRCRQRRLTPPRPAAKTRHAVVSRRPPRARVPASFPGLLRPLVR
jgi:anti-anti-sigma factor